jgi:hypothetical protein
MNKQEKEDTRKRIVNFYNDAADGNLKKTVNFFLKQGMKRSTIYYTIQKYTRHKTTKDHQN